MEKNFSKELQGKEPENSFRNQKVSFKFVTGMLHIL